MPANAAGVSEPKDICLSLRFREPIARRFYKLWLAGKTFAGTEEHLALARAFEGWQLEVSSSGPTSLCVRCSSGQLQKAFDVAVERVPLAAGALSSMGGEYVVSRGGAIPVPQDIARFVESISIQRPYIYAAPGVAVLPPPKRPAGHGARLDVLKGVPRKLRATKVHARTKGRGAGVKVCVIDSGFVTDHVFFGQRPFSMQVALAGLASDGKLDDFGHGTGVAANLLSVAPEVDFIGIKLHNESLASLNATLLEGFQTALTFSPDVISISLVSQELYDPNGPVQPVPLTSADKDLADAIKAVADKIVIVVGAGNGQFGFPSQMSEVIAAGGVYASTKNRREKLIASDMASAFISGVYPRRAVPDVCGLVGLLPNGEYLTLPVGFGSFYDKLSQGYDGSAGDDGWAVFSGTSSAAPQLAGVCALMLGVNPGLTPAKVKKILCATARDVTEGTTNPKSGGIKAVPGRDVATGAGLVDAFAAWTAAKRA
ncbi:MAG: S8 family serine peptidase [Caldimonas sp.]